jgi:transmembrane sensor
MERPTISSNSEETEPAPDVVGRAAEWLAHLESGDADDADIAAFTDWRASHPSHALAVERMGGLKAELLKSDELGRATLRRLFLRPRRRAGGTVLAIVGLLGVSWYVSRLPAVQMRFADERTAIGETRALALPDGSRLTLASGSVIKLDVGERRREVQLLRGEVLAEVAKGRPVRFRVETSDGSAEALGTAYTVRKDEGGTVVTVIASRVRACAAPVNAAQCTTLSPGERARIATGTITRLPSIAPDDAAAWTEGWLPANEKPLADLLDELNRWRDQPIRFDRPSLSGLLVSGIFPLRDADSALANLARSQPITIDRTDPASPFVRRNPE